MLWAELREEEFNGAIEKTEGLCVIPMGCYEMHGQHLPVCTDNVQAERVVKLASEIEEVCIFPTFQYGDVQDLVEWKGAIRLEPQLMMDLLENLCKEISRNGFKKILIVNYHGGNVQFLNNFMRAMYHKKKDYVVMAIDGFGGGRKSKLLQAIEEQGLEAFPELLPEDVETLRRYSEEKIQDGHGGLDETCALLSIRPDLVKLDRADVVSGLNTHEADDLINTGIYGLPLWKRNFPNSYAGQIVGGATERIGNCMMRIRAERLAKAYAAYKKSDILEWNEACNSYYAE